MTKGKRANTRVHTNTNGRIGSWIDTQISICIER